LGQLPPSR